MDADALVAALLPILEDTTVSRAERRDARDLVERADLRPVERLHVQHALVQAVAERLVDPDDQALVDSLGDLLAVLHAPDPTPSAPRPLVRFGPEDPMVETLLDLLGGCRATLDIAVFTLTDDRLAGAVIERHRRGVAVRILTDDDKSWDRGSDVDRLVDAGIPLRLDHSPHHFHHKFALLDGRCVVTGSYNWTRGADRDNRENFLVSWDPALVAPFQHGFEHMWETLGRR